MHGWSPLRCVATRRLACSLLVLCALSGPSADAAEGVIRFAPERDYPPFIYANGDGRIEGLSADMLQAIAPELGARVETLPAAPLASILAEARAGRVDLISSLRPTEERRAFLDFSQPYALIPAVLVTRQHEAASTLEAFAARPVAVGRGYAVESFLRSHYPALILLPVASDAEGLARLEAGTADAVVADVASVHYLLRKQTPRPLRISGSIGFEYRLSFAWRKELAPLGARIDKAITRMSARERRMILARWLPPEMVDFDDPRIRLLQRAGWSIAVLIALAASVLAWRRRHRAPGAGDEP